MVKLRLGRIVELGIAGPCRLARWLLSSVLWSLILLKAQLRFPPPPISSTWNGTQDLCVHVGVQSTAELYSKHWRSSEGRFWVAEQRWHCTSQAQHGNHTAQHHCDDSVTVVTQGQFSLGWGCQSPKCVYTEMSWEALGVLA